METALAGMSSDVGYDVLDLAGVLGRGMDEHFVVLAGDRHGDLAFQVEVVLAADHDRGPPAGAERWQCLGGVAALQRHAVGDDSLPVCRAPVDVQDGGEVFVFGHRERGRRGGLASRRFGGDREQGLAGVFDHVVGEQRFVVPAQQLRRWRRARRPPSARGRRRGRL